MYYGEGTGKSDLGKPGECFHMVILPHERAPTQTYNQGPKIHGKWPPLHVYNVFRLVDMNE
jgi:hypothetical protein